VFWSVPGLLMSAAAAKIHHNAAAYSSLHKMILDWQTRASERWHKRSISRPFVIALHTSDPLLSSPPAHYHWTRMRPKLPPRPDLGSAVCLCGRKRVRSAELWNRHPAESGLRRWLRIDLFFYVCPVPRMKIVVGKLRHNLLTKKK